MGNNEQVKRSQLYFTIEEGGEVMPFGMFADDKEASAHLFQLETNHALLFNEEAARSAYKTLVLERPTIDSADGLEQVWGWNESGVEFLGHYESASLDFEEINTDFNDDNYAYYMNGNEVKEALSVLSSNLGRKDIKSFINGSQLSAINEIRKGEEGEAMDEMLGALMDTVSVMPRTSEQEGLGDEAAAYLHYFRGGMDWYIMELESGRHQQQTFGFADLGLGMGGELGYISIEELLENDIEVDLHFEPMTIVEIREKHDALNGFSPQ